MGLQSRWAQRGCIEGQREGQAFGWTGDGPSPEPNVGSGDVGQGGKPVLEIEGDTPSVGRVILEGLQDTAPNGLPENCTAGNTGQGLEIGDYAHLGGVGLLHAKGVHPTTGFLLL